MIITIAFVAAYIIFIVVQLKNAQAVDENDNPTSKE